MDEFTARIKITPAISAFLKNHAASLKMLPKPLESYWKPKGVGLRDFPPGQKAIRIRIFLDTSKIAVVEELNTLLENGSYTNSRIKLFEGILTESEFFLNNKGYEKWAENHLVSIEYQLKLADGATIKALEEEIDGKKTFVKFEAENEKDIEEAVGAMGLTKKDLIFANRAELLAKQMGLL